jgi:hypothetical protein
MRVKKCQFIYQIGKSLKCLITEENYACIGKCKKIFRQRTLSVTIPCRPVICGTISLTEWMCCAQNVGFIFPYNFRATYSLLQ